MNTEYQILEPEQDPKKLKEYWDTGIGLQAVDGLKPTDMVYQIAEDNINQKYDINEAVRKVVRHYDNKPSSNEKEADIVSSRIAQLLADSSFNFSPVQLKHIHGHLFEGVLDKPITGKYRTYNITKGEPILEGRSVNYATFSTISDTLDYDFKQRTEYLEANGFDTKDLRNLTQFIANIWQVHPFGEGNTRTVAVFLQKYLTSYGIEINNEPFAEHAEYFRNTLVIASYDDLSKNIQSDRKPLNDFLQSIINHSPIKFDQALRVPPAKG